MAGNKIQLKRTSVAGRAPSSSDLDVGELAINLADSRLFTKDGSGNVVDVHGQSLNTSAAVQFANVSANNLIANTITGNLAWSYITSKPDLQITLAGDITGSNTFVDLADGTITTTLANTAVTPGSYGNSSAIPVITVDSKGRITAATTNTVAGITGYSYTAANNTFTITAGDGSTYKATIGTVNTFTVSNTLTVNGVATFANDVNISGNLVVTGSLTYVNTNVFQIADEIITLNSDASGTPSANVGFEINRGTSANTYLIWDETTDKWSFTNDGTTYYRVASNTDVDTAYSNATSYADTKAATAYSNATSYADTKAATAYSNATSYADTKAATAYTNAVAYAASNSYVNSTFAKLSGATFTGAVAVGNTLASGNTTVTGYANVSGTLYVGGDATINGNLYVNGNTVTVNTSQLNVTDSLIYLASNNEVSDTLDIGFVAHYNAGSGANGHTGFVRSASTKKYYLFQNYQPELFSNNNVDFANVATGVQMADIVVGNATVNSNLTVTGNATFSNTIAVTGNASFSNTIDVTGVSTFHSNVIVTGSLTVTGSTTYVNTNIFQVSDNIITLNADATGSPTDNVGFEVNRGSSPYTYLIWDEGIDKWTFTNDGTNYYNVASNTDVSTAYSNAVSYADTKAATAYSNATSYADTKAATAYSNATSYADTAAATAYSNAVSTAATDASTKAATAYSNATSYADTKAATAYSNATSYADTKAATAYSNAVAYAAANTYVNSTFAPKSSPTFTGIVTTANVNIVGSLSANGGVGTAGQVLTSNGTSIYWSTVSGGGGGFTNGQSISVSNVVVTDTATLKAVSANGSLGSAGQVLTTNGSNVYWSTVSGGGGGSSNSFGTISVSGQTDVLADQANDVLTLVAGSGMTITTNPTGDTITFTSSGGGSGTGTGTAFIAARDNFTADGIQTAFTLSLNATANSILVAVDGLIQFHTEDYDVSGTTLTFSTAPANNELIEVLHISGATNYLFQQYAAIDSFSGNGSNTVYTLTRSANTNTAQVYLDGLLQNPNSDYSLSGTTLTFTTAPLSAEAILVYHTESSSGNPHLTSIAGVDTFAGDGSTAAFTLSGTANSATSFVTVNGLMQRYTTDYTLSGTTLTFVDAPPSGSAVQAWRLTGSLGVTFKTVQVSGQSDIVADQADDILTFANGAGITITTNATTDTLTIAQSAITKQSLTGNGSNTIFTLSTSTTEDDILVYVDGLYFHPTDDYTVSGTTLTFTTAPINSAEIRIRYLR